MHQWMCCCCCCCCCCWFTIVHQCPSNVGLKTMCLCARYLPNWSKLFSNSLNLRWYTEKKHFQFPWLANFERNDAACFFQGNDVRWKSSTKRYPRLEVIQAPTASVWAKKIQPVLLGENNWAPRRMVWKMILLISMGIWGVHVSFQGCMVFPKECLLTERENPRESYIAKSNVKVLVVEAASGELVSLAILSKHCSKCDTWPTVHIDWKASVVVMQLWTRIMTPKPCLVI